MSESQRTGTIIVLASATCFGTLSILAKYAYAAGLGAEQALAFRFGLAAVGMLAVAFLLGHNPLRLGRSRLLILFGMGFIGYCAQSFTYFLALRTLPASLVVLIAYMYPSLVVAAGWLFLRRRVSPWHLMALVASFVGLVLLVGGGAHFELSWALVLAVASPVIYTAYILVGERVMDSVPALPASAVIISGAALAFAVLAALGNQLALPPSAAGWAVAVGLAVVPTMLAISLFLAGLPRVGAARAALLSTWEPVVTVGLAVVLLGDRMSPIQVLGAILVLAAVIVVQGAQPPKPVVAHID
ncbi:MAG TPA: DMT family transporter [Candidatus Dormibacteraeota bacterium]|nr:DMT family transporter [Candidatus Dormibacteraeota bacterium]